MSALSPAALDVLAIIVMANMALLMRTAGFWLIGHVAISPRVQRMLEALPGSIVVATVLPIVARTGPAAALAVIAAGAVMILRRNELLAVAAGVLAAALARSAGIN